MLLKISDLQLNTGQIEGVPTNPRTITEKDFEELKDSLTRNPDNIKKFPLVIAEHKKQLVVISGNQRLRAMQALGWTELEHVGEIYPDGTDPEILKEAVIIANTHKGEWDYDMLANEWDETELEDWGLDTTQEWDNKKELPETIDDIPEPPKDPITKLGDIWLLGNHRVICGDSTDKATVEKLMDGKKADMVFTDPPYGYSYESNYQTKHKMLKNDDQFLDFLPNALTVTAKDCPIYICAGWQTATQWDTYIKGNDLTVKNIIIWKKNNWSMGDLKGAYAGQYEMVFFAHKGRVELKEGRDRDVWEINREPPKDHPTTKPVELMTRAINNHSGKSVLDLFLGSGSTLIACEQTDRLCYGLELDPHYVDVICKRWQTLTGQLPIFEATGEAHDFIGVQ